MVATTTYHRLVDHRHPFEISRRIHSLRHFIVPSSALCPLTPRYGFHSHTHDSRPIIHPLISYTIVSRPCVASIYYCAIGEKMNGINSNSGKRQFMYVQAHTTRRAWNGAPSDQSAAEEPKWASKEQLGLENPLLQEFHKCSLFTTCSQEQTNLWVRRVLLVGISCSAPR